MRGALRAVLATGWLGLCCVPRAARADHCHPTEDLPSEGTGQRLTLGFESASYRNSRYEGVYEGWTAGWSYAAPFAEKRLNFAASLPAYRLNRNGLVSVGVGDAFAEARAELTAPAHETRHLGLVAATTLPSGDASAELGMGHVMLFGGGWATVTLDALQLQGRLTYAAAVAAGGAHHEHAAGTSPLVSPMNVSEVAASLSASYELAEFLRLRASGSLAVPVFEPGTTRAIAGLGVLFVSDWFDSALEGQLPLAGDPFTAKLLATMGARF